jgi:hypothetical protein
MPLTDLGPFADADLLLLASLAAGPKQGYAMLAPTHVLLPEICENVCRAPILTPQATLSYPLSLTVL